MDDKINEQNSSDYPDWNDESGEIHTVKKTYYLKKEDDWQKNHSHSYINPNKKHNRIIKGKQVGFTYVTDDYRIVIPGYIISTIIIIAACIVAFFIHFAAGIIVSLFAVFWIIGFWKNASFRKWKNQKARIQSEQSEEKAEKM